MTDRYGMTYVFRLEIEGQQAVQAAKDIRAALEQELGKITVGGAAGTAQTTRAITGVGTAVEGLSKKATEAKTRWQAFQQAITEETRNIWALRRVGYGIESLGRSLMRQGLATGAAIGLMTKRYIDFDDAAALAAQAMRLNVDLYGELKEEILDTSVALARFRPEEIAAGLRIWAAGTGEVVQSSAQLNRLIEDTINIQKLAAMNNEDLARTMEDVGGVMGEYQLTTADVTHITEILNYVAATTFATVGDMGQAFKMVGPVAHSMGISFEESAVALGLMSDQNIKATMAGRAFRQMLIRMAKPTGDFNESMNKLLQVNTDVGESWRDIVFPKGGTEFMGLAEFIELLAKATQNLTLEQRTQRLAMLATANELPALIALVSEQTRANEYGVNVMRGYHNVMMGILDEETVAFKEYMEQVTGLPFSMENAHRVMTGQWDAYTQKESFRMQQLQRTWTRAILEIGEDLTGNLLPVLEDVTDVLMDWLEILGEHPGWTKGLLYFAAISIAAGSAISSIGFLIRTITNLKVLLAGLGAAKAAAGAAGAAAAGGAATGFMLPTGLAGGLAGVILSLFVSPKPAGEDVWGQVKKEAAGIQQEFLRLFGRAPHQIDAFIAKNEEALGLLHEQTDAEDEYLRTAQQVEQVLAAIRDRQTEIAAAMPEPPEVEMARRRMHAAEVRRREPIEGFPVPEEEEFTQEERDAQLKALYDYYQRRNEITERATERAKDILRSYNEWEESAEAELRRRLISLRENFERTRGRRQEDYEIRRSDVTRKAQRQDERAAKRHNDEMRRLEQDHADRMIDLLEARDVMGIVKEVRRYQRDRGRARQSYEQQRREQQEEAQQRSDDLDRQHRLDEERRAEDYKLREQELVVAHERERQDRKDAMNEQLLDLQEATRKQLQELRDAFFLQLAEMREEREILLDIYGLMYDDVEAFWNDYIMGWASTLAEARRLIENYDEWLAAKTAPFIPFSMIEEQWQARPTAPSAGGGGVTTIPSAAPPEWEQWSPVWRDWRSLQGATAGGNGGPTVIFSPQFNGMGARDQEWYRRVARQQAQQVIEEVVKQSTRSS